MYSRRTRNSKVKEPEKIDIENERKDDDTKDCVVVSRLRRRPRDGKNNNETNKKNFKTTREMEHKSTQDDKSEKRHGRNLRIISNGNTTQRKRKTTSKLKDETSASSEMNNKSNSSDNSVNTRLSSSTEKSNNVELSSPISPCSVVLDENVEYTKHKKPIPNMEKLNNSSSSSYDKSINTHNSITKRKHSAEDILSLLEGEHKPSKSFKDTSQNMRKPQSHENLSYPDRPALKTSTGKTRKMRSDSSNKQTKQINKTKSEVQTNSTPTLASWLSSSQISTRTNQREDFLTVSPPSFDKFGDKTFESHLSNMKKANMHTPKESLRESRIGGTLQCSSKSPDQTKSTPTLAPWLATAHRSTRTDQGENFSTVSPPNLELLSSNVKEVNTPKEGLRKSRIASTPRYISQSDDSDTEDLFGFENLLNPVADVLEDVSPIISHQIRRTRRSKKVSPFYQGNNGPKEWNGILDVTDSHWRKKPSKTGAIKTNPNTDNIEVAELSEIHLFEDIPEEKNENNKEDGYYFQEDQPLSKPKRAPRKPIRSQQDEFNIEEQLPWREIMEHELVIESV